MIYIFINKLKDIYLPYYSLKELCNENNIPRLDKNDLPKRLGKYILIVKQEINNKARF